MSDPGHEPATSIHTFVSDVQVLAGAARYATIPELLDIFSALADRAPKVTTRAELMILRHLLANVTRYVYRLAGAGDPRHAIATLLMDAGDPRVHFRVTLLSLASQAGAAATASDPRIQHFHAALERRYSTPSLTAADVAPELGISMWHLARLLRTHTGIPFRSHLRQVRMRHAARLLRTTEESIKSVGISTGYLSPSEFHRHFRLTYDASPSDYRRGAPR